MVFVGCRMSHMWWISSHSLYTATIQKNIWYPSIFVRPRWFFDFFNTRLQSLAKLDGTRKASLWKSRTIPTHIQYAYFATTSSGTLWTASANNRSHTHVYVDLNHPRLIWSTGCYDTVSTLRTIDKIPSTPFRGSSSCNGQSTLAKSTLSSTRFLNNQNDASSWIDCKCSKCGNEHMAWRVARSSNPIPQENDIPRSSSNLMRGSSQLESAFNSCSINSLALSDLGTILHSNGCGALHPTK